MAKVIAKKISKTTKKGVKALGGKSLSEALAAAQKAREKRAPGSHLVVIARAGTGKTFSLVEGLNRIWGRPTKGIVGSPQQEAVWAAMVEGDRPQTVAFMAFGRSIKDELKKRVPPGCVASTLHGYGWATCNRAYGKFEVDERKTGALVEEVTGEDIWELRKERPAFVEGVTKLVNLCKLTLTGWIPGEPEIAPTDEELTTLCNHYGVELNGDRADVFRRVPEILKLSRERTEILDYADMVWLPIVNRLPCYRYDLLLVDEAQDLNRAQQELALLAGKRLVLCGDPRQAIYGFAGADTDSIQRMVGLLGDTSLGVKQLPLTVTRRCGKRIVEEAKALVPDFDFFPENGEGAVSEIWAEEFATTVAYGDMVLCRVNAPLVSYCFRLIRAGRKATIQGREIGTGLLSLIDKLKASSVEDLIGKLDDYFQREAQRLAKRKNPSEAAQIALQDKRDCLLAFTDGALTLEAVKANIRKVFTDDKGSGVLLSSIHRAKGLEAKRVFILEPQLLPHPMAKSEWQRGQEANLKYVAITRAIESLFWVEKEPEEVDAPLAVHLLGEKA